MDSMAVFETVCGLPRADFFLPIGRRQHLLVRLLGGALDSQLRPWSVADSHATLRRSRTRFDSWRGHFASRESRDKSPELKSLDSGPSALDSSDTDARWPGGCLQSSLS